MNKSIILPLIFLFLLVIPTFAAADSSNLFQGHSNRFHASTSVREDSLIAKRVKYTLLLNNNSLVPGNFVPSETGGQDFPILYLGIDSSNGEIYAPAQDWRGGLGQTGLLVIDGRSGNVAASVNLPSRSYYGGMAFDTYNKKIYIASSDTIRNIGIVSVIDTKTHTVTKSINVHGQPTDIAFDSANGYLYAAGGNNVSVIDGSTDQFVKNIQVNGPYLQIAYDSQNGYLYVSDETTNNVTVIDGRSNKLIYSIPVTSSPTGIAYDRENGYVYVAGSHDISVINTSMKKVVTNIPIGKYECISYLASDPLNGEIYADGCTTTVAVIRGTRIVGNFTMIGYLAGYIAFNSFNNHFYIMGSNIVSEILPSSNRVTRNIYIAFDPTDLVVDLYDHKLFALEPDSASISVIETMTNKVIKNFYTGLPEKNLIFINSNRELYLTSTPISFCKPSSCYEQITLTAINPVNYDVIANVKIGEPILAPIVSPIRMVFDSSNKYLYIATGYGCHVGMCWGSRTIAVVDTKTNSFVSTIHVPEAGYPNGIAFDSQNGYIYSADLTEPCHGPPACMTSNITVINGRSNRVIQEILVNGDASNIGYNRSNGMLYVSNDSNVLTVINGSSNRIEGYVSISNSNFSAYGFGSMNGIMLVSGPSTNQVAVIGTSDRVLGVIDVGGEPSGITGDPRNSYFYVGNSYSGTLSIIS